MDYFPTLWFKRTGNLLYHSTNYTSHRKKFCRAPGGTQIITTGYKLSHFYNIRVLESF